MEQPGNLLSGKRDIPEIAFAQPSLKPYNLKELAGMYGVSVRTLSKWIEPFAGQIGKRIGYFYTIPQVKTIFLNLGLPGMFEEE